MPLFIASSIWVPTVIKALKLGKYWANKYLCYIGNKFFTTMVNCSSSLGLFIICAALDLHLVMKVEKDSFDSCLVVSKSLLVTSTSMLYLYCLWNSQQMSSQLLALASSRLRNYLRVAPVKVFWNIWASSSLVAPKGCMALMYIFKWDFGQPIPSNLSKVGILNLGGNLTSRKSESYLSSMRSSILWVLLIISSILFILLLIFFSPSMVGELWSVLFSSLTTLQVLKLLYDKVYVFPQLNLTNYHGV